MAFADYIKSRLVDWMAASMATGAIAWFSFGAHAVTKEEVSGMIESNNRVIALSLERDEEALQALGQSLHELSNSFHEFAEQQQRANGYFKAWVEMEQSSR